MKRLVAHGQPLATITSSVAAVPSPMTRRSKLAHHDYKLRGHGYDVVYPNDISPDDDNGEA